MTVVAPNDNKKSKTPILRTSVEALEQKLKRKAEEPPTVDSDFAVVRQVMPLIEKALDNHWYLDDLAKDFEEAGIKIDEERLKRLVAVAKREREKQ